MKLNLDALKPEIESYLKKTGLLVFYGFSRGLDDATEVEWDTVRHPDHKAFVEIAKQLGVKLICLHHREFSSSAIDRAVEELPSAGLEYDEQREYEQRLRELAMYDGLTCVIELSFEYEGTVYLFELETDWHRELDEIMDQIDTATGGFGDDDEENPLGGYYSKN